MNLFTAPIEGENAMGRAKATEWVPGQYGTIRATDGKYMVKPTDDGGAITFRRDSDDTWWAASEHDSVEDALRDCDQPGRSDG